MRVGYAGDDRQRDSMHVDQQAALARIFSRVRWIGSNAMFCQRSLAHRAVDRLLPPGDVFHLDVLGHAHLPELYEETLLVPVLKMRVDGAARAKLVRYRLPLTAGAQHIDDGGEYLLC